MTTTINPVIRAWETFQADTSDAIKLRPPETEAEYDALVDFLDDLTSGYDCNEAPQATLFDLVAAYIDGWERQHYADLKDAQVPPYRMLAYYLEQRGLTAYKLAKDLGIDQGNLSTILRGDRGISKELAKNLALYFNVSVEVFI